jgi:5-methylcytosine-specific restriction protein A
MPGEIKYHTPGGRPDASRVYDRRAPRQADKNFYSSARWREARAMKLRDTPLCGDCLKAGRLVPAKHVHHTQPRHKRPDLAFDQANLEALCQPCHNARPER